MICNLCLADGTSHTAVWHGVLVESKGRGWEVDGFWAWAWVSSSRGQSGGWVQMQDQCSQPMAAGRVEKVSAKTDQ